MSGEAFRRSAGGSRSSTEDTGSDIFPIEYYKISKVFSEPDASRRCRS